VALVRRLGHAVVHGRSRESRGYHPCRFCDDSTYPVRMSVGDETICLGSAELRVSDGTLTYAAPNLILHYVSDHKYLPPSEFIRALVNAIPEPA
jgi:hypothetical protein